jgi:hypothetical protein
MKKLLIILVIVFMATPLYAVETVNFQWNGPFPILAATVTTGAGAEFDLGQTYNRFNCVATWGGTAPTSITFGIALADKTGIYDSTGIEDSITMTASPTRFYLVNKQGRYIKGNYVSKVVGDATTSLKIDCSAGY